MSSSNEQIQKMYDEIENVQQILLKEEQQEQEMISSTGKVVKRKKDTNLSVILYYIKKRLSINNIYMSRPLHYKDPFKKLLPREYESYCWGGHGTLYSIAFIECNIIINMPIDMIKKIPILNAILLENKGSDKPLTINFKDYKANMILDGPILYISKLPLGSLMFKIPPREWVVTNHMSGLNSTFDKYFRYNSVEEAIMNRCYFD
tara:strand:+ start:405 stop:1019 length:615 start_codon:yes stop_codon:yes gene_type:complete